MMTTKNPVIGTIAAWWGVLGVVAILLFAIVRLAEYAQEAIVGGLNLLQWIMLIANVVLMAWAEGYRGFQRRFSPRVAARAFYLSQNATPLNALLAPLFCISYFHANTHAVRAAWLGTAGIIVLVLLFHQLDQPWRGILDAGVVVGLTWGLLSIFALSLKTFRAGCYYYSPDIPGVAVEIMPAAQK